MASASADPSFSPEQITESATAQDRVNMARWLHTWRRAIDSGVLNEPIWSEPFTSRGVRDLRKGRKSSVPDVHEGVYTELGVVPSATRNIASGRGGPCGANKTHAVTAIL